MTCREFADFIMDYLAGELPAETLARFERHLSRCDNCRTYLDGYRQSIALGRLSLAAIADEAPEELIQAILASIADAPGPERLS